MELATLPQLTRDVRKAAATLGVGEARTLIDLYYGLQDFRIQAGNQTGALTKSEEPHETITFFHEQFYQLETDIQKALDTYSNAQPLSKWARQHVGVGPVIAAGLLAHITIEKTPTPSALWKFAGLAPGQKYVKGQKRDWNAQLKLLSWKLSSSFVKHSGREGCYYGKLYLRRKEKEVARNEAVTQVAPGHPDAVSIPQVNAGEVLFFAGGNAATAAKTLEEKQIRDATLLARLRSGKLPDGQIDMRARRYAVKRFLLHYWQQAWWMHYGTEPPRAYVFEHLNHIDEEPPPIAFIKPSGQ